MNELFDVSSFSSKNDATRDFQLENLSSKKKLGKKSHAATDPAWDNESAFPEVSSKNICQAGDAGDGKPFKVGQRCEILTPKKYSGEKGHVCGCHEDESPEFWVKLDSHDLQIRVLASEVRFLEETEIISTAAPKTGKSKISDCWYTPPEIIALIQQCLEGITLDPCADDGKHIESCYHLTATEDGLSHQWFGRVFMNPPYSCPGVWIAKLQEEFSLGRVEEAIALVPVATDTKWFHPLISSNLICFWKGRIKFLDVNYQPKMPARQSHCLIYWGKNQSRFRQVFSPFGTFNSSEEKEAMSPTTLGTNAECYFYTPVYVQESPVLNSELKQPESVTSSKQNYSLKTTPTLKQSSNTDFLVSPSIATLKTTAPNQENSISTQSVFPAPAPALQATELDLTTQNQACGFKPCAASPTASPISPSSKILRGLSVEDFEQCLEDCEWSNIVGTIHKSFQQRNSERRTSVKGFSSLPTASKCVDRTTTS
jgi:phage N-6-adenine-methyltransferase